MSRVSRRFQFAALPDNIPSGSFSLTSVTPANNQITVTWDEYPGATGYRVARDGVDTTGGGPWTGDLAANARSWTALYLVNGNTYNLTVQPLPDGPVASESATAGSPGEITSINATVASNTQINLTWSYSGASLTNYTLRRGGTVIASPAASATSYNNSGLTAGTTYNYTLVGNYAAGGTTATVSISRTTSGGGGGSGVVKIMPLGDSITYGLNGTSAKGGYRQPLRNMLIAKYPGRINFVGSVSSYPTEDPEHEGHSGWVTEQLTQNIAGWLNTYDPAIIMLHIGTNDIYNNAPAATILSRVDTLLGTIYNTKPNVRIALATIIPYRHNNVWNDAIWQGYRDGIPGLITKYTNLGRQIRLADIANAGLSLGAPDINDGTHPVDSGFLKMANTWDPVVSSFIDEL